MVQGRCPWTRALSLNPELMQIQMSAARMHLGADPQTAECFVLLQVWPS